MSFLQSFPAEPDIALPGSPLLSPFGLAPPFHPCIHLHLLSSAYPGQHHHGRCPLTENARSQRLLRNPAPRGKQLGDGSAERTGKPCEGVNRHLLCGFDYYTRPVR